LKLTFNKVAPKENSCLFLLHALHGFKSELDTENTLAEQYSEISRRAFLQIAGVSALALGADPVANAWNTNGQSGQFTLSPAGKKVHDLSDLSWKLAGFPPYLWKIKNLPDIEQSADAEIRPIDAPVPGSVQLALLKAGVLQDWNLGLNARGAEWVENRDWIYQTSIPDEWVQQGQRIWLRCAGLDYVGNILLNGVVILPFKGSFVPYEVDLKPHLKPTGNVLQIWFQPPPRWLGEFGYTSEMKEWKVRFNYYWDWTSRLVQAGIWDRITLEAVDGGEILTVKSTPTVDIDRKLGALRLEAETAGGKYLHVALTDNGRVVREETVGVGKHNAHISWDQLPVELWWPSSMGEQQLYNLEIRLLDDQRKLLDSKEMRIGFRRVEWKRTHGAPDHAHPYLCVVNGKPVFLYGVNWTPIRPNFADLGEEDYRKRVTLYRELGMNLLRVWGGAFLERQWFYDLCDENGLLVWQEFPLSSSGLDNYPPDDQESIDQQAVFARSYIQRIHHHPSLVLWGGGNELLDNQAGRVSAEPSYTIRNHPMVIKLGEIVKKEDGQHQYVPTAPFGPVGVFTPESTGKGKHWDVHGPYDVDGPVTGAWAELWKRDDAMFHSEMGAPSASSAEIIRRFSGNLNPMPATHENLLWNRQPWWVAWDKFIQEKGHEPNSLEEYVDWTQQRQSDALAIALTVAKSRFPACGGLVLWMGHDAFPCTANLSIVDFDGNPKPAALKLKEIIQKA
jgi:beta-mannosidase